MRGSYCYLSSYAHSGWELHVITDVLRYSKQYYAMWVRLNVDDPTTCFSSVEVVL